MSEDTELGHRQETKRGAGRERELRGEAVRTIVRQIPIGNDTRSD